MLKEKIVNCYKQYLTKLNCGIIGQNYCLLYKAILSVKNNISDKKYVEFFENNLNCPITIKLTAMDKIPNVISWVEATVLSNDTVFTEISAPTAGNYTILTNKVPGYNFLYITAPSDRNVRIYDDFNDIVFDSKAAGTYQFSYVGNLTTSNGSINKIYRKNNVYNSNVQVPYYINLY